MVFIAVMADRLFGFEVGPRQWIGLSLTAVGLVLLGVTLPAMHGAHSQFSQAAMISFEAGLFGLGALLIMGPRMGGKAEHHGVMLGAASGILFGVSDTAIKALTGITHAHGLIGLMLSPWLLVAVLASIVAFYASARGLQDGEAVPGDRRDGNRREHRRDRRWDHRIRRSDGGQPAGCRAAGDRVRVGRGRRRADAGTRPLGRRRGHTRLMMPAGADDVAAA